MQETRTSARLIAILPLQGGIGKTSCEALFRTIVDGFCQYHGPCKHLVAFSGSSIWNLFDRNI